jgi:hypothetical protein
MVAIFADSRDFFVRTRPRILLTEATPEDVLASDVMICLALVIFVASEEEMMRLAGSQEKVAEGKLSTYRDTRSVLSAPVMNV